MLQFVLGFIAVTTLGAGLLRILWEDAFERIDQTTLLYLAGAGILLLLPRIEAVDFGKFSVKLREIAEKAAKMEDKALQMESMALALERSLEQVRRATQAAQDAAVHHLGPKVEAPAPADQRVVEVHPGGVPDDPWKGVFGGKAQVAGRRLSAEIESLADEPDYFLVTLTVESTPGAPALGKYVQFFLHDTFGNDRPVVQVSPDHRAYLHLKVWGAFTVGVIADGGSTMLELDLAEVEGAPREFRER